MIIDVVALGRMVLDDSFLLVPKRILDFAHLIPRRAAVSQRYTDMIPVATSAGYDVQVVDAKVPSMSISPTKLRMLTAYAG